MNQTEAQRRAIARRAKAKSARQARTQLAKAIVKAVLDLRTSDAGTRLRDDMQTELIGLARAYKRVPE